MRLTLAVVGGVVAVVVGAGASAAWLLDDAARLVLSPEPSGPLLGAVEAASALLLGRCAVAAVLVGGAMVGTGSSSPVSRSSRAAVRVTPGLLRPAVSALLALGLAAAAGGPALASTRTPPLPAAGWSAAAPGDGDVTRSLPVAGWVPTPREGPPAPVHLVAGAAHRPATSPPDVVVRRGDTLWAIVARALGPHATVARVAAEWPRWYAANRQVIGGDPDLLRPGTALHAPSRTAAR